ncbi:MAG: hypothetical protein CSB13_02735 [Chloroflexi bacterium]|nr:MAG: hypothetical protein CSB13_02735 [Chloroflexota bacterium]
MIEIRQYIAPLLKWWWLIILATVLAGITSFFVVRQQPIMFQSRATLMIGSPFADPNPDSNEFWLSDQLAEAYADFARREPIRVAVMEALDLDSLPQYSVSIPARTRFIEVSVVDTNPRRAQAVANELANQLILLSPSGEDQEALERQEFIDQQLDDLQVQIEETIVEIEEKQIELGGLVGARDIAEAQDQIAALRSKLSSLQLNYSSMLANSQDQATNILSIIETASLPQAPIGSRRDLTVLIAGVLGAVLAGFAAYLIEFLDDRVRTPQELERIVDVPVLMGISSEKLVLDNSLIVSEEPRSPVSEMFRDLRTKIQIAYQGNENRSLLVTSATAQEGKSFVSANLALVFVQAGFKTLLIDADLRIPDQHLLFKKENKYGLTDILRKPSYLADEEGTFSELDHYITRVPDLNLDLITSGSHANNPSELLTSPTMKRLISHVSRRYDFVIIDSAPSLMLTDSLVLGYVVGGVLMVINAQKASRDQVQQFVSRYRNVDANIIGITMNKLVHKKQNQYYYYEDSDEQPPKVSIGERSWRRKFTKEKSQG